MLRIVTPLTTLPFVLFALAVPARDAEDGDGGGDNSGGGPPSRPGRAAPWGYAIAGDGDGMYTVQVLPPEEPDDPPRPRRGAGDGAQVLGEATAGSR
ncbi:hypothetical protein [Streptomyces sp. DH37]|uniref:hypothetical protein n=1 Tax=Streptomyces sp. DH37 TaxID=3040122 RepID=UPI002442B79D|nr:hypothetical protein [Streptomyces sp. DH37]MDG9700867.1 hypothetical protein [Streptomyces sp. DH37]